MKSLDFEITKGQKIGLLSLLFLIILTYFGWKSFSDKHFFSDLSKKDQKNEMVQVAEFKKEIFSKNQISSLVKRPKLNSTFSSFNPNELNLESWMKLGFTKNQAVSILNYKKSLGGFSNLSQLEKSFVISKEKLDSFKDYLVFKKPEFKTSSKKKSLLLS